MKKYLFILKFEFMSKLHYIFDLLTGYISYAMMIFIFLNLWQYIYSDPSELINGYTMSQMIWYIIITEILWMSLSGKKLCYRISDDVKGGNIAYNINKPYSYISYSLSRQIGDVLVKLIMYIIVGMIIGFVFLKSFPTLNILMIIAILIVILLAQIINSLLCIFIGLFSFIIEDSHPFYWLYSKLILVLGTIFPIEFFPKVIQPFITYSPIYVVSTGPAKLFVNFNWSSFIYIIIAQVIYVIISYSLCFIIYKKGVKNLNVNGG